MCKISIIIPIYNADKYLSQCIRSVLKQSLLDIEILCINDGCTDDSFKIVDYFLKKDKRIKAINNPSKGVANARNLGISLASGDYIAFLDADDFYPHNNVLESLYNVAINNHVFIAGGSLSKFDSTKKIHQKDEDFRRDYRFQEDSIYNYHDYQFDYGFTRFIYNRNFLLENNLTFPNYSRYQDPPFFVKAMLKAKTFYAIKQNVYTYRIQHKTTDWTSEENITGFLKGIIDNLSISKAHGLNKLHYITAYKLCLDFYKRINISYKKSIDFESKEIELLLRDANNLIDFSMILKYFSNSNNGSFPFNNINTFNRMWISERNEFQKSKKILNGMAYRISRTITYLPWKIKNTLYYHFKRDM